MIKIIYLKKYGTKLQFFVIETLIVLLFLTISYYFNIISEEAYSLLKLTTVLLAILYNSFQLGKITKKKGYKEGLKFGLLCIFLLLITSLFFTKIQIKSFFYYTLILASSTLGSVIGSSQKKNN